jgi:hypothetical protein
MKCVYIDFCGSVIELNLIARQDHAWSSSPSVGFLRCTLLEFRGGVGSLFLGELSTDMQFDE